MKNPQADKTVQKDIELIEEMINCEYYDFRIEALAQKIKVQNFKPKRMGNI